MSGYIISEDKTFQIFLRTEDVIEQRKFPAINQFINDEENFFLTEFKKGSSRDRIIELGCGGGRLLRAFGNAGFYVTGLDNDRQLVEYCRNQGLDVIYGDVMSKLPKKFKNTFKVAVIGFNTLFNFPKEIRKTWIKNAADLLVKDGLLLFTAYAKNQFADRTVAGRLKFYNFVMRPTNNLDIRFSRTPRTCIEMVKDGKILWFSEWHSRDDLVGEVRSWEYFKLKTLRLLNSKTSFGVAVQKIK